MSDRGQFISAVLSLICIVAGITLMIWGSAIIWGPGAMVVGGGILCLLGAAFAAIIPRPSKS